MVMFMVYDFGTRLKTLREAKGLTQEQVSQRIGVTKSSISAYENNLNMPPIDILRRLVLLYATTADYVLGIDNRTVFASETLTQAQADIINSIIKEFECNRS